MEEPKIKQIVEPLSCAMRGRSVDNPSDRTAGIPTEQRLEIGSEIANCLTSVQKDSMIVEPIIDMPDCNNVIDDGYEYRLMPNGNIRAYNPKSRNYEKGVMGYHITNPKNIADTVISTHKPNVIVAEPSILGYTRDDKGNVTSRHEKEIAGVLHTSTGSGGNTDQFVKTRYRIRKLTPRECFRLMDVDDADIDKIEAHRIKVTQKNGTVKEKPIPKSRKYALAGNSIVVNVLYHIFHQIFIAEPPEPKPIQKSLFDF